MEWQRKKNRWDGCERADASNIADIAHIVLDAHELAQAIRATATVTGLSNDNVLLHQLFMRIVACLRSQSKLGEPADVQAVASITRSVYETTIDMGLMCLADDADAVDKLRGWETSALVKHAHCICRFFRVFTLPSHLEWIVAKAKHERDGVLAQRKRWWHDAHPPRWTGCGLDADARRLDALIGSSRFSTFYETSYRAVCWLVHGSSTLATSTLSEGEALFECGRALAWTAEFSLLAAKLLTVQIGIARSYEVGIANMVSRLTCARAGVDEPRAPNET